MFYRIGFEEIAEEGGTRRERERTAVLRALRRLAGPEADIKHDESGAPLLVGAEGYISVTHSRHTAAVLWSSTPGWGIDLEEARGEQLRRVAPRVLNPDELELFGDNLLKAWTIKEAAFKAAGLPIADLRELHIHPDGTISARDRRLQIVSSEACGEGWLTVVRSR